MAMAPKALAGLMERSPVRECPLCPTWVECFHDDRGRVIRLNLRERFLAHVRVCPSICGGPGENAVGGPAPMLTPRVGLQWFCNPAWQPIDSSDRLWAVFPTEAEARAEFDRRVALMLGRELE